MVFDGYWKRELKKLSWAISVWKRVPVQSKYIEHRLSRAILHSATVLRKAIEDENEAVKMAKKHHIPPPECTMANGTLSATKPPYTDEEGWAFRGKFIAQSYGEGQVVSPKVKDVCNWLLHSYVWSFASYTKQTGYAGFLVASDYDKEKCVHFVSFDEWQNVLAQAIEKGAF